MEETRQRPINAAADPFDKIRAMYGMLVATRLAQAFCAANDLAELYAACRYQRRVSVSEACAAGRTELRGESMLLSELATFLDGLFFRSFDFARYPVSDFSTAKEMAYDFLGES